MNAIVGHCPKCGAPIYAPTVWHGITPPPSTYSCSCFSPAQKTVYGTTTNWQPAEKEGSDRES
jgi:hypothetical protein